MLNSRASLGVQSKKVGKVYPAKMRSNSLFVSLQNIGLFHYKEHKCLINQILSFQHFIAIWLYPNPALPKSKYKDDEKGA